MSEARLRARGQWLHAPGGDVVRHLLAVQAQNAGAVPYALAARGGAFRDGLLVTWLMRSTLHLVDADDLAWLHPLFAPRLAKATARRRAQLGVTDALIDKVAAAAPTTRAQLGETLGLTGQALPHAIAAAAIAGRVALTSGLAAPSGPAASAPAGSGPAAPAPAPAASGPAASGLAASGLAASAPAAPAPAAPAPAAPAPAAPAPATSERVIVPLDLPPPPDRDASLDELARRYYACHAGADARDLAYWSGLPLRDCRPPASGSRPDDGPVPDCLIPAFDELLLGWRDRTPTVPAQHAKRVHPGGGVLRATVLEDGVAVGTWTRRGETISIQRF